MHVESEVDRAAIDLNETDSLLDNIVTQLGAVLSLKHTHQTIKAWELEKGVAPFP